MHRLFTYRTRNLRSGNTGHVSVETLNTLILASATLVGAVLGLLSKVIIEKMRQKHQAPGHGAQDRAELVTGHRQDAGDKTVIQHSERNEWLMAAGLIIVSLAVVTFAASKFTSWQRISGAEGRLAELVGFTDARPAGPGLGGTFSWETDSRRHAYVLSLGNDLASANTPQQVALSKFALGEYHEVIDLVAALREGKAASMELELLAGHSHWLLAEFEDADRCYERASTEEPGAIAPIKFRALLAIEREIPTEAIPLAQELVGKVEGKYTSNSYDAIAAYNIQGGANTIAFAREHDDRARDKYASDGHAAFTKALQLLDSPTLPSRAAVAKEVVRAELLLNKVVIEGSYSFQETRQGSPQGIATAITSASEARQAFLAAFGQDSWEYANASVKLAIAKSSVDRLNSSGGQLADPKSILEKALPTLREYRMTKAGAYTDCANALAGMFLQSADLEKAEATAGDAISFVQSSGINTAKTILTNLHYVRAAALSGISGRRQGEQIELLVQAYAEFNMVQELGAEKVPSLKPLALRSSLGRADVLLRLRPYCTGQPSYIARTVLSALPDEARTKSQTADLARSILQRDSKR